MAAILIKQKINGFDVWKKEYDAQEDLRFSNGMLKDHIYLDANDPHQITILFDWDSVENARKFTDSPKLKEAMQRAGVIGRPEITFLKEI